MGNSQIRVQESLETLRQQLPFPLCGIDSDNGSEFINAHLLKYCRAHDVQFTRGHLFLPSVKLQRKERHGARLRRYYDAPQTPLDRVRGCLQADARKVAVLVRQRDQLDPFVLAARVDQQLTRLYTLATHRRTAPPTTEGGAVAQAQNACATASPQMPKTPRPSVTPVVARRSAVR